MIDRFWNMFAGWLAAETDRGDRIATRLWEVFAAWLASETELVDWLIAHCKKHPYFDIYHNGDLYMARYWLVKERKWLPFAIRLHEWHRPDQDQDRDLHDHPADYRTIMLRGWYLEKTADNRFKTLSAGETRQYPKEHYHSVTHLGQHERGYSLFIYWGPHQMWGFMVNGKKVPWQQYVNCEDYPVEYHKEGGL